MTTFHAARGLLRPLRTASRRIRRFAYRTTMGPTGPAQHTDNTVPVPHHRAG